MRLGDWQKLRIAVHSGTGAVHKLKHIVVGHSLQQDIGAGHVIVIVLQRNAAGFPHSLQCSKVSDHVDFVLQDKMEQTIIMYNTYRWDCKIEQIPQELKLYPSIDIPTWIR